MIKKLRNSIYLITSLLVFFCVLTYLDELESQAVIPKSSFSPEHPTVTVLEVSSGSYQTEIEVFGEVEPRWAVTLKSQASGEVMKISPNVSPGVEVREGQPLMAIEASRYESAVANAELALDNAKVGLRQAEVKTELAHSDWNNSGMTGEPSDLALFKPQLSVAQSEVRFAEKQLQSALKTLGYTKVLAPFNGIVTERHVGLGQSVSEGDALFTLLDNQHLELQVSLDVGQWKKLDPQWQGAVVPLRNMSGESIGSATIRQGGSYLDSDTRQFKLFLEVLKNQESEVLPGEFVKVVLPGKTFENTMLIPESAMTREGMVWYLDEENRLRSYLVDDAVSKDGKLIVSVPPVDSSKSPLRVPSMSSPERSASQRAWRIATVPLASFLPGMQVSPMMETGQNTAANIDDSSDFDGGS
ncbi:hypothetical protein BTA51_29440 [Hahella sp. CCB-MM4]|uniref:efflux RND transporter periplasmic adaptor subunit n=1 Tax=Hahella sp. (strain CCB-MM4) TaxID=1926491 RepID=UPI000B9A9972|nr:efflux RND transporter periplasmic adaptor subunit [Hahella sp. CCB-MM4]OZG69749.1 hypothetical protein BTA51_29440 [Hahella sp. CCB-MM4]